MNELKVIQYTEELTKRGVAIPDDDHLYKVGVFNGEGSY